MAKKIILLFVIAFMLFFSFSADAFTLKKGTVSFGGASTMSATRGDSDRTDSSTHIGGSAKIGYFITDNFEIGGELGASYSDSDYRESKGFSISPFATYHFELNETSNIYLTGMIGISRDYTDYDDFSDDGEGVIYGSEVGWEYFFSPSVSGTIGLKYERVDMDNDSEFSSEAINHDLEISSTYESFGTVLGFKIYF